jgi:hypothetical protein
MMEFSCREFYQTKNQGLSTFFLWLTLNGMLFSYGKLFLMTIELIPCMISFSLAKNP